MLVDLLQPLVGDDGPVLHASVQGSAAHRPLASVGDLDVQVVVGQMTPAVLHDAAERARECCRRLARATGREWFVELRQGPIKPDPAMCSRRQLHLLLDDCSSLRAMPPALLHHRSRASVLAGTPLHRLVNVPHGREQLIESCIEQIERAGAAVRKRAIPIRAWEFGASSRLLDRDISAASDWELRCLLRAGSAAADRLPLSVFMEEPSSLAAWVTKPTFYELLERDIERFAGLRDRWDAVQAKALAALDTRVRQLRDHR